MHAFIFLSLARLKMCGIMQSTKVSAEYSHLYDHIIISQICDCHGSLIVVHWHATHLLLGIWL